MKKYLGWLVVLVMVLIFIFGKLMPFFEELSTNVQADTMVEDYNQSITHSRIMLKDKGFNHIEYFSDDYNKKYYKDYYMKYEKNNSIYCIGITIYPTKQKREITYSVELESDELNLKKIMLNEEDLKAILTQFGDIELFDLLVEKNKLLVGDDSNYRYKDNKIEIRIKEGEQKKYKYTYTLTKNN